MDCNKEEATRARVLAEEKMRASDFVGAHKLIMKAQRLFPELEDIQKMITVCDVHSAADKKIKGLDDWYGILQVQPSDDFDIIKKQYRKLCLLLHPDKNEFPGAEAAFKLVAEANRWLSDQIKRSQYDVRYRSHSLLASRQSNASSRFNSSSANAAAMNVASGLTFWTCCRNCGHRYKYLRVYMNQLMHCSACRKSYTACNIGSDEVPFSSSTADANQEMRNTSRQHPCTGAESGSSSAAKTKNGALGKKLKKRNPKKQKREAGDKKPKKDEGCTESEVEGGKPQKGETVANSSMEVPKPDVLKPQPEVKEPETSSVSKMNENGTVIGKLKKKNQKKKKREAGDKKPKKDEGCTESEAEGGRLQKGETVASNSVEVPKPDVSKPHAEVKKPETSSAAEMNNNGTVGGKLSKKDQESQKQDAGDRKPEKDEGCTEKDLEGAGPQNGAEIPKPDIQKPQAEEKEPQTSALKSMPDISAPEMNQTAKKKRKAVDESSTSFEVDGSDAAVDETNTDESSKRKFSGRKPQVSYAERGGNGDSVIPPTKKTKSGFEFESDLNTEEADEDDTSPALADSGVLSASSHAYKGKVKKSANSGKKNIVSAKSKESEGSDHNGEDAALSSKMGGVENGYIPDREFNVFEDERKPENFAVNQVWSTCDSRDGMPRRYARVTKVLALDFKLRITYLQPVQEKNDDSIPVAWGKFKNGETVEVENRSIFSGQMLNSICNRVVSIYPRKGEIWAMFRDWDEESNTPENHGLPYKYDFVEIVNDFKEEAGIGGAYLGKVKGFVSIYQREAKNRVCQSQFTPEEMLRFSHKVPAVKMTGMEKEGVPAGSYELDPTALPKDMFQVEAVNLEMDSETMKGKADSPDPEALENGMKAKPVVPEIVPSPPRKRQKSDDVGGCSNCDKVCSTSVSIGEGEASRTSDSSSSQVNNKSTPSESSKSVEASDAFKLRKSPRLQTTPSQQIKEKKTAKQVDKMNCPETTDEVLVTDSLEINKSPKGLQQQVESQVGEGSKKRGRSGKSKQNDLPAQLDGSTKMLLESTPASSSCKTPQRNAFDFKNERSADKFRRDQIWATYSDDKGLPTDYVKIKKVETKPELVLHVVHMELCEPSTRSVSCGEFKMETGKPQILPLARFSHRVKPFDGRSKIVKVYPRKGDVWALRKNCDSTKEEHDVVEVVEGYCEGKNIKVMALTTKGFSSVYTRRHGSNVCSLEIPKEEMSRFSHQIPAVKQEKRATRVAEGGYWELDPAAIPHRTTPTIVID
ncbi:DNAJ heat shock N-terminal domain-containing protein [Hirschfeldia incana]|nr:DNAJ heat shock N-terminal domain-containing protein [Hirschfeldia incana]